MSTKHDAKIDIMQFMVALCLIPDEILDLFCCGDNLSWLLFDEAALAGGRQVPMDLSWLVETFHHELNIELIRTKDDCLCIEEIEIYVGHIERIRGFKANGSQLPAKFFSWLQCFVSGIAFAVYPWNYRGKLVGPPNIKVSRLLPETGYFRSAAAGSRVVAEGHFLVELPMYPAYRVIWYRKPSALFEQRKVGVEHDYGADFVVVCNAGSDSRKVYNNRILNFSIRLPGQHHST
jgi:hypothetical protein